ncbi:MAG TPA: hypothetical protein DD435_06765 [Cyanobacteria bacterium UBA8530]|nr:hypothetical protein [Cyanobacteria bacterium UBA8530]
MSKNLFGEHLVSEEVITREVLERAIEIQLEKPYLRIGEILFSMGAISFHCLDRYLKDFHQDIRIGQLLIYRGIISQADLEKALNIQERDQELLGKILIGMSACTETQIQRVLQTQHRYREGFEKLVKSMKEKD